MAIANTLIVFTFTLIHINASRFHLDKYEIASKFSSVVGGISIAYVFFHLLPGLIHAQEDIALKYHLTSATSFQLLFGMILLGLVVFYFLEVAMQSAKMNMFISRLRHQDISDQSFELRHQRVFWAHVGSYALYNLIIGVLLADQHFATTTTALFYLVAIGLHFFTNDWVLRHHFTDLYDKYGRLMITLSVLVGWLIGHAFAIDHAVVALLEAFVAGGLILNAIKDELPECSGSNMMYFISGTAVYSLLLIIM